MQAHVLEEHVTPRPRRTAAYSVRVWTLILHRTSALVDRQEKQQRIGWRPCAAMPAAGGVSLQLAAVLVVLLPRCHLGRGDDAVLEHEVTPQQAEHNLLSVQPQREKVPGCGECTYWERFYCISHKVLDDHCCCDMRYAEWFPYVPHQCYLEEEMCTTHAANCEEYMRIRMCCCDLHTVLRWKYLLSGEGRSSSSSWLLLLIVPLLAALLAPS